MVLGGRVGVDALDVHPIKVTPPPDFITGFSFDGFAVELGVVFYAAAESCGLREREDVLAVLAPAVFPAEFHNPHPHGLPESGKSWIGRRRSVVLASRVMR